jgi:tetratricopeptide (TPR) repeat protein
MARRCDQGQENACQRRAALNRSKIVRLSAVLVSLIAAEAGAAEDWIGQVVVLRPGVGLQEAVTTEGPAPRRGASPDDYRLYRVVTVEKGRFYLNGGDEKPSGWARAEDILTLDQALIILEREIVDHPDQAWRRVQRAIIWGGKEDYLRAIGDCNEAIRLDPKLARAYLVRGNAHFDADDLKAAINDYGEAIRLDPGNAEALASRGSARGNLGQHDDAIADCNAALRINARSSYAFRIRASEWHRKGQKDRALADFNEAIRLNPFGRAAYRDRGMFFYKCGDYSKGIADLDVALRLNPRDATALLVRACAFSEQKRNADALADIDRSIRLNPKEAKAFALRGSLRAKTQDLDGAMEDVNRSIQLDPRDPRTFAARAELRQRKGDLDRAISDYDTALGLDRSSIPALIGRARVWQARGNTDKAIADYDTAIQLQPKSAELHVKRGICLARLGKDDEALAEFDSALRLDSSSSMAYVDRGNLFRRRGLHDRAIADFSQAIRNAGSPSARGGEITLVRFEVPTSGLVELPQPNQIMALAHMMRGMSWRDSGRYAEAQADFAEVVRLAPRFGDGYRAQALIWACCPEARFRNGAQALASARRACELTEWKEPLSLTALAAACAESGDFASAVRWEEKAQPLFNDAKNRDDGKARIKQYKAHKPGRHQSVDQLQAKH